MLVGAIVIGVAVGSLTGLLGAGGAIIALPLLVYVLGIPMGDAVPMMLAVGVLSPLAALVPRLRTAVDWRSVAAVGAGGIGGAFAGTAAGKHLAEPLTLVIFALLMALAGIQMLRPTRPAVTEAERPSLWAVRGLGVGVVSGFLTGLLGLGGGFIVIPLLMLVLRLSFTTAVGTSLVVTVLNATSGLIAHWQGAHLDWPLMAGFGIATVGSSLLAAQLSKRIRGESLQRAFAVLVLALAVFTLIRSVLAW